MHRVVQTAAGRGLNDPPLTFGDLWNAPTSTGSITNAEDPTASPRAIELTMIASDISRNRMVQLPFIETPSPIYVETKVLDDYFPSSIARWMKKKAGKYDLKIEHCHDRGIS
jgi:hypothetical protein